MTLLASACSQGAPQQSARETPESTRRVEGAGPRRAVRPKPVRPRPVKPPVITVKRAAQILYPPKKRGGPSAAAGVALAACRSGSRVVRIRCLLARRYASDKKAARLARAVYDRTQTVVGLEPARRMDGGWRGKLKLVPALLVGRHRRHLKRISVALRDIDQFFRDLGKQVAKPKNGQPRFRYRWRALAFKAFRSVGRATPSAYAWSWTVAYNVNGSLLRHQRGVRQTLFHELFHLNDSHHKDWSERVLGPLYKRILKRCTRGRGRRAKLSKRCLKPYAPHRTTVRGGIYYAFHPESGVQEYGAELAVRYFLEQRIAMSGKGRKARFKCGTPENGQAWRLLAGEFFGGADRVPACP